MLYQLLDELSRRIDGLQIATEAPRFAAQLRKMRPSLEGELKGAGVAADQVDKALLAFGTAQLLVIKAMPALAGELANLLKRGAGEPAFRCVVASSLAYLVQPRDLLPDDLPGGYGFLDDALLLHEAAALSWEVSGDAARAAEKRKVFQFIFTCVPDGKHELFQTAISGLATAMGIVRSLGPMIAEMTTQAIIANPLQPVTSPAAAGVTGAPSPFAPVQRPQYSWQSGNTIGVNFPGGGGVASDGRNIFVL